MTQYDEEVEKRQEELAAEKWGEILYQIEADGWKQKTTYYYNSGVKEIKNWETGKTDVQYPNNYTSPTFINELILKMRRG